MQLIKFLEIPATSWKNGLGLTWEIAADRSGCSNQEFRWRLSRARITETCSFSAYPGVRRWLALAAGSALELKIDSLPSSRLGHVGEILAFDGGATVEATPVDGPVEDLNLMLADSRLYAEMLHRPLLGSMVLPPDKTTVTLFHLLDGEAHLQGSQTIKLMSADTLLLDGKLEGGSTTCRLIGFGSALIIRISQSMPHN